MQSIGDSLVCVFFFFSVVLKGENILQTVNALNAQILCLNAEVLILKHKLNHPDTFKYRQNSKIKFLVGARVCVCVHARICVCTRIRDECDGCRIHRRLALVDNELTCACDFRCVFRYNAMLVITAALVTVCLHN